MELPDMSRELKKAAKKGDTNFLKDAIKRNPSSLLTELPGGNEHSGNIFHIAAWNGQVNFIDEAIKDLPDAIRNILLFHHDRHDWTPLHAAVFDSESSYAIVKLILDYYDSMPTDVVKPPKPWLELTNGKTPLHMALEQDKKGDDEASAMELLLMDVELLSNTDDENGNSPLFLAVKKGYSEVAAKILTPSSPSSSISFSGSDGSTPLHFAPNCSEKVFKLLLRNNFSESIDKRDNRGYSALHQWAEIGKAWPCKLLLESRDFTEARTKIFKDLVCAKEINNGDTPLHISAKKKESNLCQILVQGYRSKCEAEIQEPMTHSRRHELECQILNNQGESPFFTAVMMRCESAVVEILSTGEPHYNMLVRNDGTTVLHYLHLWPGIGNFLPLPTTPVSHVQ